MLILRAGKALFSARSLLSTVWGLGCARLCFCKMDLSSITISGLAVERWVERIEGEPQISQIDVHFDKFYDNELMEFIYPKMEIAEDDF